MVALLYHTLIADLWFCCSLGSTLTDALDDLIGAERIDPQLAMKVLTQFDRIVAEALSEKVKARLTFKVIPVVAPPFPLLFSFKRGRCVALEKHSCFPYSRRLC